MKTEKAISNLQKKTIDDEVLPEGWNYTQLKEIAKIEWGNTSITKKSYCDEGFKTYSASGQDGYLPNAGWEGQGIILSAIGARCGKCFFAEGQWNAIKNTIVIQGNSKIINHLYLFYFLNDEKRWTISGSGQPFITLGTAKTMIVPLPSIAEQQRIVNRIEALSTHTNAARERLNRVSVIMKRFRREILTAACSGKLTDEWRNGKDLPEWVLTQLKSLSSTKKHSISSGPFGSALGTKDYQNCGVPVIRGQNIKQGTFIPDNFVYISESKANDLRRSEAVAGDIVIVAVGSSGQVAMVPDTFPKYILSQNCNKFSFNSDFVNFKFILFVMQTNLIVSEMQIKTTDTARPFLSLTSLKSLEISLPPLAEQHEIVRRVGLLFERADAFDQKVAAAGWRCERLTQAVLGKAFAGKL